MATSNDMLPTPRIALHHQKGLFSSSRKGGTTSPTIMREHEDKPRFLFVPTVSGPSKSQSRRVRQICNAHVQHNVQRRRSIAKQSLSSYRGPEEDLREALPTLRNPARKGRPSPPIMEKQDDSSAASSPPNSATSPSSLNQIPSSPSSPRQKRGFHRPPSREKLSLRIRGKTPPKEKFYYSAKREKPDDDDSSAASSASMELWQPTGRPFLPNPRTLLDTPNIDPFSATALPLPRRFQDLLQHFWQVMVPHYFPKLKDPHGYADWLVSVALTDAAALHSCLFAWTADLEVAKGIHIADGNPQWLEHRMKGIRLLNERFNDPQKASEVSTLLAVGMLMAANMIMGNEADLAAHAEGFQRLVTLRGGWHGFPTNIVKVYLRLRYFGALVMGHVPPSPPIVPQRPLLLHNTSSSGSLPLLGSGFADLLLEDTISPSFYNMVNTLTAVTRSKVYSDKYRHLLPAEDLDFFSLQDLDIEYQLMIFPTAEYGPNNPYPAHRCLRTALLVFYHTCLAEHGPTEEVAAFLSRKLRHGFEGNQFDISQHPQSSREVAVWALCMGAHISEKGSAEYKFYITVLVQAAQLMQLRSFEQLLSVVCRSFYLETKLRGPLENIWEDAVLAWAA